MDKSKEYLKKCAKAIELQNDWQPKNGDWFYGTKEDFDDDDLPQDYYQFFDCEDDYYAVLPKYYNLKKKEFEDETDCVWLPSLEDMQGMLLYDTPLDEIKDFADWVAKLTISEQERFRTTHQLWLGFVMYKNHTMVWNGKDWVFKQR
ncbi:MAG: hypothetical protein CSB55_04600 [Candidatus Cloacimonadota bacterium]|nr:MAG: hypothetical protein CSB55_04600 [Candidatus Cloacimonadota bacterium]